ncbi:hypothetical protein QTN25_000431 [Entamoeba marina]
MNLVLPSCNNLLSENSLSRVYDGFYANHLVTIVQFKSSLSEQQQRDVELELNLLQEIQEFQRINKYNYALNIIDLNKEYKQVIYERNGYGTVDIVMSNYQLPQFLKYKIYMDIATAIGYCHELGVLVNDVCMENISIVSFNTITTVAKLVSLNKMVSLNKCGKSIVNTISASGLPLPEYKELDILATIQKRRRMSPKQAFKINSNNGGTLW